MHKPVGLKTVVGRLLGRAAGVYMPGWLKARSGREASLDFAALVAEALEINPQDDMKAFRAAAREAGRRAGEKVRRGLWLGEEFIDAEVAWRVASKASGLHFTVARRDGRSEFAHRACPIHAAGGARLCANFCLPFVSGLTDSISQECGVMIIREADETGACVKALVHSKRDDE